MVDGLPLWLLTSVLFEIGVSAGLEEAVALHVGVSGGLVAWVSVGLVSSLGLHVGVSVWLEVSSVALHVGVSDRLVVSLADVFFVCDISLASFKHSLMMVAMMY